MAKLHSLENTELSEYCLNILEKHDIHLAREFVGEPYEKLMKILNLNFDQVKKIKKELARLYGPAVRTLNDKIKEEKLQLIVYNTQIQPLDEVLSQLDTLCSKSFWEICGPTGVGKTQLAFSLVLNFIIKQKLDVLFIDSKLDFSGGRIKQMLKARKIQPEIMVGIMSSIKVERVFSAQAVIDILECLCTQLQLGNPDVITIKLIVIDSLPAVWFLMQASANRLSDSLTTNHVDDNNDDVSDIIEADDMDMENKNSSSTLEYKPVLGYSWLTKPRLRLSMEYPSTEDDKDSSLRIIKVIKSRNSHKNASCLVKIQDVGVVGLDFKVAEDEVDDALTL